MSSPSGNDLNTDWIELTVYQCTVSTSQSEIFHSETVQNIYRESHLSAEASHRVCIPEQHSASPEHIDQLTFLFVEERSHQEKFSFSSLPVSSGSSHGIFHADCHLCKYVYTVVFGSFWYTNPLI